MMHPHPSVFWDYQTGDHKIDLIAIVRPRWRATFVNKQEVHEATTENGAILGADNPAFWTKPIAIYASF
jgi:hypothetical protein